MLGVVIHGKNLWSAGSGLNHTPHESVLMGNFSLFPFILKYRNNAILGAEAT